MSFQTLEQKLTSTMATEVFIPNGPTGQAWDNTGGWQPVNFGNGWPGETQFTFTPSITLNPDPTLEEVKLHFSKLQDTLINLFKSGDLNQATFLRIVEDMRRIEKILLGVQNGE